MTNLEALQQLIELISAVEKIKKSIPPENEIDSIGSKQLQSAFHLSDFFLGRAIDVIRIKAQEFTDGDKPTASFL
jgi:hypothetical protein